MRLLTRKLKSQSLEEEEEGEEGTGSRGRRSLPEPNNDTMQATEFDSGTASDEDVTEFEKEPCLRGVEAKLHNCQVIQIAQTQMDRTMPAGCFSSQPNATSYSSSTISPHHVVSSIMPPSKDSGISPSGQQAATLSGRLSAVSWDFEWCSLDLEPLSSSCSEMDHHSSEEELVSIYRHEQKRKHSQMSPDNQCTSGEEDEKLDAERRFPRDSDHHRPLSSSNHHCLRGNDAIPISAGHTSASDFTSPRKRHRQTSINSTGIQRPSLDLYKMQKTSITRKYSCSSSSSSAGIASTNCRPRVVKIRTINGSSRPVKSAYNPSVFCFRSISWASSRLKEEPFRAF